MFLRTPVACVSVSPYRSRDPAGASALRIGGVVPLIHMEARFAGMRTLADIGDALPPRKVTVVGAADCCAPAWTAASAIAPTMAAIAPARARIPPTRDSLAPSRVALAPARNSLAPPRDSLAPTGNSTPPPTSAPTE